MPKLQEVRKKLSYSHLSHIFDMKLKNLTDVSNSFIIVDDLNQTSVFSDASWVENKIKRI